VLTATGAAQPLAAVLGYADRDQRQLLDLPARRLTRRRVLAIAEDVPASAAAGPVLYDLIHRPRRQQRTALARVPRLSALRSPRAVLAAPWRATRGIGARGCRGVARVASELALELLDPCLELLDAAIHRQQDLDNRLASCVIDRFGLRALHTPIFDSAGLCPPGPLNAYENPAISRVFVHSGTGTRTPNSCSRGTRVANYTIPERRPTWTADSRIVTTALSPQPRARWARSRR
jgi:hypothetical protein